MGMADQYRPLPLAEMQRLSHEHTWDIIDGGKESIYANWLLRGELGEPFNPVAFIAAFYAGERIPMLIERPRTKKPVAYYKDQAFAASLPAHVRTRELMQYPIPNLHQDEALFQTICTELALNLRPSGILVFSQPDPAAEESIYLFGSIRIRPSRVLLHIQQGLMPPEEQRGGKRILH